MNAPKPEAGGAVSERRAKILAEAANVFYEKGFAGACIDDLIARVGGSKRTIYNEFGSKEGLFVAMIEDLVHRNAGALVEVMDVDEKSGADLREVLLHYGRQLCFIMMKPDVLAFQRIIIAEGLRFPKLAQAFYETGPARSARRLAEILDWHSRQGHIELADCRMAAEQFGGLIRDGLYMAVLLGLREPLTPEEQEARVTAAVDLFLRGVKREKRV